MMQSKDIASGIRKGMRVLVVEDSFMTARGIAHLLQELGAEVLGPVPSVVKAMELLDLGKCDAAVLDINLGNETVEPVAKRLEESGLPYFFVSGYASPKSMLSDARYRRRRLLPKPVEPIMFREAFSAEFGSA